MDTPLDIKLRAVKIFRHMHTDIGMARQVHLLYYQPILDLQLTMLN